MQTAWNTQPPARFSEDVNIEYWLSRHSRAVNPHRALLAAVLESAVSDILAPKAWKGAALRRREALAWIHSNDRVWPFAFLNICEHLDLDPTKVREELLG